MKKMKRQFMKGTNWALAGLLGLFGFACSDDDDIPAEYGTPHANYHISGHVKNKLGEPVPDIKIEVVASDDYNYTTPVLSNSHGLYNARATTSARINELRVIVSDIDKEDNGLYQNDTILVQIKNEDYYEEGEKWNVGSAFKEVNITLKNIENE